MKMKKILEEKNKINEANISDFISGIFLMINRKKINSILNDLKDKPELMDAIKDFNDSYNELKDILHKNKKYLPHLNDYKK